MIQTITEIVVALLLLIGGGFALVGSWGLVRLPDPMTRLHAPTKAATLGVGGVLIASMLYATVVRGAPSWHELLITLFLFLTAPVTGLFIAKAQMHLSWDPDELPRPAPGVDWLIYAEVDQMEEPEEPVHPRPE